MLIHSAFQFLSTEHTSNTYYMYCLSAEFVWKCIPKILKKIFEKTLACIHIAL